MSTAAPRLVVHVVPCGSDPAAVFADLDEARIFATHRGAEQEPESTVVADGDLAQALIAAARDNT